MPVLSNPKHEAFAQALFKGQPAEHAYVAAGFARNSANAIRLKGNERVKARVAELQAQAAKKTVQTVSFNAVEMFKRLQATCDAAEAAGDHKAAIDGQKFIIRCFGYEDNPSLTNDDVAGRKLPQERGEGDEAQPPATSTQALASRFPDALKQIRNRMN